MEASRDAIAFITKGSRSSAPFREIPLHICRNREEIEPKATSFLAIIFISNHRLRFIVHIFILQNIGP